MTTRLRHVARINPPTPEFDGLSKDAVLPFVPLEAVWPGDRFDASRRRPKREVAVGYTRFLEGDVLVPKITPTFQADRTVIARPVEGGVGAGTTELHVVRPSSATDHRYIRYLLSSKPFLDEGQASMIGVAGQKRVPDECLRDLIVPIVDRTRQSVIANYLDAETARIDALVAMRRRMIELIDERFRSYRVNMILRGLDPTTGKGVLPHRWSLARLGVLIGLHRGFDLPSEDRREGAIPVVSSGGVSGAHAEKACDGPGVVTGRYGTVGEVFFVEGPYWPLNTTLFVSEFRGNIPRWIYHLLSVLPLDADSAKAAVTGINRNVIGTLRAPCPTVADQVSLAAAVDTECDRLNRIATPLGQQVALLLERRKALITAAVTGELDVSGVAA